MQVGEPIMYPEINALVDELHARRISSFLVTNAQFPDAIRNVSCASPACWLSRLHSPQMQFAMQVVHVQLMRHKGTVRRRDPQYGYITL
eukprot:scaffold162481_cov23-Tisochrysis_lutea.AAC.1